MFVRLLSVVVCCFLCSDVQALSTQQNLVVDHHTEQQDDHSRRSSKDHLMKQTSSISSSSFSREHDAANFNADRCTIPVIDHTLGSQSINVAINRFATKYLNKDPVILRGFANEPAMQTIKHLTSVDHMRRTMSSLPITLATANTYSYNKLSITLSQYFDQYINKPVSINQSATDIMYWFGDHEEPKSVKATHASINILTESLLNQPLDSILNQSIYQTIDESETARMKFRAMLASYPILQHAFVDQTWMNIANQSPSQSIRYYSILQQPLTSRYSARLSFGLGSAYSGTPMHWHSSVFAHLLHGAKRWFLFPPYNESSINQSINQTNGERPLKELLVTPQLSAIQWVDNIYMQHVDQLTDAGLIECVAVPGDILYLPDHWLHATLNMEPSVFMSIFMLDECATAGNRCGD